MTATTELRRSDVLADVLATRHSCRAFLPQRLHDATLRELFAMAQRTASWCNSQPWEVHLLRGAELSVLSRRLIARAQSGPETPDIPGPARYEGVYQARRRTCGFALYSALGIDREDHDGRLRQLLENFRFFGAPHVAIISSPTALGTYGVLDCGGYVANLLNAAESLGVNAIAQAAPAMYSEVVRDQLAIPDGRSIVCAVSFGIADHAHPANRFRTVREDVDVVVRGLR